MFKFEISVNFEGNVERQEKESKFVDRKVKLNFSKIEEAPISDEFNFKIKLTTKVNPL